MEKDAALQRIVRGFTGRRVLVAGDVILDRYWWGDASRLSPEAPVPVVRRQRSSLSPGGAANTAANLAALGASAELVGVTGDDPEADQLQSALSAAGVKASGLIRDRSRPTTTKTRIVAAHHQIVRVDDETTADVPLSIEDQAAAVIAAELANVDAAVFSDYAKGFLSPGLLQRSIAVARGAGVPVFVDPKGADWRRYLGASLLKPN